jgi:hypothetical protein
MRIIELTEEARTNILENLLKTVCEHGIREKNPQTYLKNKPPFAQKMSKRAKNHHFFMENIKNSTWSTNFILYICIVLLTNKRFFAPKRKIQQV